MLGYNTRYYYSLQLCLFFHICREEKIMRNISSTELEVDYYDIINGGQQDLADQCEAYDPNMENSWKTKRQQADLFSGLETA